MKNLLFLFVLLTFEFQGNDKLNIARPEIHDYVKPEKGRNDIRFADHKVNKFRVYNFYQRQAEYYMKNGFIKNPLPSYPGLDAGKHGHWGKYNQNGYKDGRWNLEKVDYIKKSLTVFPKTSKRPAIEDGINIILSKENKVYACFSPRRFNFLSFWKDKFLYFNPYRWGTSRGALIAEKEIFASSTMDAPKDSTYYGYHRVGNEFIFSYKLMGIDLLDKVEYDNKSKSLNRHFELKSATQNKKILLSSNVEVLKKSVNQILIKQSTRQLCISIHSTANLKLESIGKSLFINIIDAKAGSLINLNIKESNELTKRDLILKRLSDQLKKKSKSLDYNLKTEATLSKKKNAYVIDDIQLPFENKTKTLFFLTGITFNKTGDAYISSLIGDIWKVTGLSGDLKNIQWIKVAAGLNQPFGIRFYKDKLYVLERTQVTLLHDQNGDGEFDFFENYNNDIRERNRSHSHKFGLEFDSKGNCYFVADTVICKVDSNRKYSVIAKGVRNCMGLGITGDGRLLVGPQEGTNTPATAIIDVKQGESYGFQNTDPIAAPMCYVPRGVDNSVGGFLEVKDKRWGSLSNQVIGLSYGYNNWYLILQDLSGPRSQAATVPLEGEFMSGVVRAAVNPVDGQVYTVGLDGWGDYSTQDGCLHRIRYTGETLLKPVGYKVFHNGIQIDFPIKLDKSNTDPKAFFAQMWDYLNSRQYGSPEYSVSQPNKLGHDILKITSVHLKNEGKSIFIEIPMIQPVMQMHLHMKLKTASGIAFKADIFPTIISLAEFYNFDGAKEKVINKKLHFTLRQKKKRHNKLVTESGIKDAHARQINLKTINMQYDKKLIKTKAGESIALVLENLDGMPHNLVIVKPGTYEKVGLESFKMLNNPKAADMHYVPKSDDVIAYTYVIQAKGKHTVYFQVPNKKGTYKFFCSFPGHWRLMKGDFIVE